MIKKLLILPILGLVGLTSLSYANTVGVCSSDSDITVVDNKSANNSNGVYSRSLSTCYKNQYCIIQLSPSSNTYTYPTFQSPYTVFEELGVLNNIIYINAFYNYTADGQKSITSDNSFTASYLYSTSPITCNLVQEESDCSTVYPTIPTSFTSGLTNLLSKFGATMVGRLPTIILVSLGIFAIFTLFRVVRNYARSSFNG